MTTPNPFEPIRLTADTISATCNALSELAWSVAEGRKLPSDKAHSEEMLQTLGKAFKELWRIDAESKPATNPYVQEAKEFLEKQPPTPEEAFKDCPVIRVMGDKDIHEAWLISSSMAWVKHARFPMTASGVAAEQKDDPAYGYDAKGDRVTLVEASKGDLPDWLKSGLATCATATESEVLLRAYDELQALGSSPR